MCTDYYGIALFGILLSACAAAVLAYWAGIEAKLKSPEMPSIMTGMSVLVIVGGEMVLQMVRCSR